MSVPLKLHQNTGGTTTGPRAAHPAHDDPRVVAALESYLDRVKAGKRPTRAEWIAEHSDISDVLGECLDGLELVLAAAPGSDSPWHDLAPPESLQSSTVLGDFRIIREIGRGGMGIVYEAEQVSLGRRVALKVLPPSSSLDPRWCERFQIEAQAAAHLRHEHIVPVFAVGSDRGVQFYAMPFIEGRTLAALIDELRVEANAKPPADHSAAPASDSASPSPPSDVPGLSAETLLSPSRPESANLPVHQRRGFFAQVARLGSEGAAALEHAHGLGILHRDVKPSNLMVDQRGSLWLTDFGLARFDEDDRLTRTGDLVGTLRYMSPEQAQARRAAVDHRTDIYSLGATLYELVTLRPAFQGRDRQELLNQIALDEPTPPRRLNPAIPRDLETIVLKAMAKEIPARYTTAREMADDLERFLEDRPILARNPSWLDRTQKLLRRHRAAVLTAAVVIVVGSLISSSLLWHERQQAVNALAALQAVRQREIKGTVAFFMRADDLATNAMGQLAGLYQPAQASEDAQKKAARVEFYRLALDRYEDVARLYRDDPDYRLVASIAFHKVGFVRTILRTIEKQDDFREADIDGPYLQAIALARMAQDANPRDSEPSWQLLAIINEYAQMLFQRQKYDEAAAHFAQAFAIHSRLPADRPEQKNEWARATRANLMMFAELLAQTGRVADAIKLVRVVVNASPSDDHAANSLAWWLVREPNTAPKSAAEAVGLARSVVDRSPQNADAWNTLALAALRAGDISAAATAIDKAIGLHKPAHAGDSAVMALIHARKGDKKQAADAIQDADRLKGRAQPDISRLMLEAENALKAASDRAG
jgi:serine/threonine protein kinase